MFSELPKFYLILTTFFLISIYVDAQSDSAIVNLADTVDKTVTTGDSLLTDTISEGDAKEEVLEDEVYYSAEDSMIISVKDQRMFLYGQAKVKYQDINLDAGYIEFDMKNQEVFARGKIDTAGNITESPKFNQGNEEFESDSLKYNFDSKKGLIYHVITDQGEGKLHGDKIKRHADGHIHVGGGKYSTCDLEHPHFYLKLTKAIVIPDDKIVSGPAYLVMEDIPFPMIGLPFGFFPNSKRRTSGIIIPSYGEELNRGFYLQRGGWYQVVGDYADLRILGNIYSKGSWAVDISSVYKLRYRFSGNIGFSYDVFRIDDEDTDERKAYKLSWFHRQDAKANPTMTFSANVRYTSTEYDKQTSYLVNNDAHLNATQNSGVSFSKNWPGTPFRLLMSANVSQNLNTKTVSGSMPEGAFTMDRIYPLRSKTSSGKYKWYENISLSYSSNFTNNINTLDSLFLEAETWQNSKKGLKHTIPLSVNFKIGNLITISPSMNYQGVLYDKYIRQSVYRQGFYSDSVVVDTINKLVYAHAMNPSLSAGFSPKLYGIFISKKPDSYVQAVRHVIKPGVSASYVPDMNWLNPDYYSEISYYSSSRDSIITEEYSFFKDGVYGTPSISGQSASVSFSLGNNIEMKVLGKNDTTGEPRKVSILDNLNFSTRYNPLKEEKKWGDVIMTGSTALFDRKLNISLHGNFSPYALDSLNNVIDRFQWVESGRKQMFRTTNLRVSATFRIRSAAGKKDEDKEGELSRDESVIEDIDYMGDYDYGLSPEYESSEYVDFDIPWSMNLSYSWSRSKPTDKVSFNSTLGINGDFSLTPKWKITYRMDYDIMNRKMTYSRFSLRRDLHCWDMSFSVIPFGNVKSYNFEIRARATLLRDLKIDKKQSRYDSY